MKVHKIEIMVIDFEEVGIKGIKEMMEEVKYPNYCINPRVMNVETADIEWSDEHPLNKKDKIHIEYKRLFS